MKKADLIEDVAEKSGITKAKATMAVNTAMEGIRSALKKGDRVKVAGIGTFSVSKRKARSGRSLQHGEKIRISARKVAKFTPAPELKRVLRNGGSENDKDSFLESLKDLSSFY